ncbi:DUF2752 domain-containing protein [Aquimarina rhabdastrellae]
MIPCLNKKFFGIDCLGCGAQRALFLLLKGEFSKAFYMYPAIYPILITLVYLGFSSFFNINFDKYIKITLITLSIFTAIISYIIKWK